MRIKNKNYVQVKYAELSTRIAFYYLEQKIQIPKICLLYAFEKEFLHKDKARPMIGPIMSNEANTIKKSK